MTSNVLESMGLGGIDIGLVIIIMLVLLIAVIAVLVVFLIKTINLTKRYERFMLGKDGSSLEDEIANLFEIDKALVEKVKENRKDIRKIYKKLTKTFQKIGIVKYDAYQQMGGMLSFSMAMLDEYDNGFILNSVHSTEGCYTYTKEISKGQCAIELGNEERMALEKAMESKK